MSDTNTHSIVAEQISFLHSKRKFIMPFWIPFTDSDISSVGNVGGTRDSKNNVTLALHSTCSQSRAVKPSCNEWLVLGDQGPLLQCAHSKLSLSCDLWSRSSVNQWMISNPWYNRHGTEIKKQIKEHQGYGGKILCFPLFINQLILSEYCGSISSCLSLSFTHIRCSLGWFCRSLLGLKLQLSDNHSISYEN